MSGQQIGSVVGGVIGAYFGGQVGYAIGSAIGGAIGGYVDPTIIKGPKLTDATQQTASDGVPIPWGHGTFPTAGNIIWTSDLFERKKEDDGKGTGVVNVTYHYYRSYAIGICQGVRQNDGTYLPIEGILVVKKNGKVVYDVRPGADAAQLAQNDKFMRETRFYLGSETQDPDSVIESHEGVGNAPAYPGTVYMVRENIELTESGGAIEQFEFVVSICGDTILIPATGGTEWVAFGSNVSVGNWMKISPDGIDWTDSTSAAPLTGYGSSSSIERSGSEFMTGGPAYFSDDFFQTTTAISGGTGTPAKMGGTWYMPRNSPFAGQGISTYDGITVTTTSVRAEALTTDGSFLMTANVGGSEVMHCRDADLISIESISIPGPLKAGCRMAFGQGRAAYYAYNDANNTTYLYSTQDRCVSIDEHTVPMPSQTISGGVKSINFKFFPALGIWAGSFHQRMIVGDTLDSMALVSHVFPGRIDDISADGSKIVAVGAGTTAFFEFSTPESFFQDWTSCDVPDAASLESVFMLIAKDDVGRIPIPDAPGWYINDGVVEGPGGDELQRCKPTLGEIVADACLRSGLTLDDIDVSELTDEVDGFKVATETTAEAIIGPLMAGFFFDAAEFDDKIRFVKRGGDVVGEITYDELCESDGDVIEETELQEAELLRKVNVRTIDPAADFTVTTQIAERRTSTVLAKGEQTTEIPVVTDKDTQARMADKKLKVGWSETRRFKSCIPYTLPQYTPTDVIGLTDGNGKRQRVRLMEMAEDSGRIEIREAMLDRQSSYTSNVEGTFHGPGSDTTPGLVGPTYGWAANLPRLRSNEIGPGAHLAACGYLRGWGGCAVLLSVDDGVSYQEVTQFLEPSSMGVLSEDCSANSEPIRVFMNSGELSSITDDQLALRQNAFAITTAAISELGQFRDSVIDSSQIYDLTNILRGGLGTTPAAHYDGDPFVMVASTKFVPLDISLAGRILYFKFVSYGTSADDTAPYPFLFNPLFFGAPVIEPYVDEVGDIYVDESGATYYSEE